MDDDAERLSFFKTEIAANVWSGEKGGDLSEEEKDGLSQIYDLVYSRNLESDAFTSGYVCDNGEESLLVELYTMPKQEDLLKKTYIGCKSPARDDVIDKFFEYMGRVDSQEECF